MIFLLTNGGTRNYLYAHSYFYDTSNARDILYYTVQKCNTEYTMEQKPENKAIISLGERRERKPRNLTREALALLGRLEQAIQKAESPVDVDALQLTYDALKNPHQKAALLREQNTLKKGGRNLSSAAEKKSGSIKSSEAPVQMTPEEKELAEAIDRALTTLASLAKNTPDNVVQSGITNKNLIDNTGGS